MCLSVEYIKLLLSWLVNISYENLNAINDLIAKYKMRQIIAHDMPLNVDENYNSIRFTTSLILNFSSHWKVRKQM